MKVFQFNLVTPEKEVLSQELSSLTCPTTLGNITILPNHEKMVCNLVPGELLAKSGNESFYIHVSGGFVQVKNKNEVVVLADAAEHFYELSQSRAEQAKERAKKQLQEIKTSDREYARVAASLERSLSRLNFARKHSHRKNPITDEGVFKE